MILRVIGAMVATAALRLLMAPLVSPRYLYADIHGIGSFLGVVGGVYSIVIAFVIYVVWDQYNRVQMGLDTEGAAIEDLVRAASMLSDRAAANDVRVAAVRYLDAVAGDEALKQATVERSVVAHDLASALASRVRSVSADTGKAGAVYDEMLRCLARASDARSERLAVSSTRIPGTLWNLVLFASGALLFGFYVLGIQSLALSRMTIAAVAGVLVFLLSVVKDMDNPFCGAWNVTYESVRAAVARMQTQ